MTSPALFIGSTARSESPISTYCSVPVAHAEQFPERRKRRQIPGIRRPQCCLTDRNGPPPPLPLNHLLRQPGQGYSRPSVRSGFGQAIGQHSEQEVLMLVYLTYLTATKCQSNPLFTDNPCKRRANTCETRSVRSSPCLRRVGMYFATLPSTCLVVVSEIG